MTPQGKPYRVSVAPSGPGQWALIVRSIRMPAVVVRLEGFGSPAHAGEASSRRGPALTLSAAPTSTEGTPGTPPGVARRLSQGHRNRA